jgi:hypothetical protein
VNEEQDDLIWTSTFGFYCSSLEADHMGCTVIAVLAARLPIPKNQERSALDPAQAGGTLMNFAHAGR